MNINDAIEGEEYVIQEIKTGDEELNSFLFSLGCYGGEKITVVAHRKGGCTVSIKDGRYNIDTQLANAIVIGMGKTTKNQEIIFCPGVSNC